MHTPDSLRFAVGSGQMNMLLSESFGNYPEFITNEKMPVFQGIEESRVFLPAVTRLRIA